MTEINLFKGHPSDDLFPEKEVLAAAASLLSRDRPTDDDDDNRHPLTYGPDQGALYVRQLIADWVTEREQLSKSPISANCINLTCGASFGFADILQSCTLPQTGYTRRAFIVSPCYYLINSVFIDCGFKGKLSAIREDLGRLDLDQLEADLDKYSAEPDQEKSPLETVGDDSRPTKKIYKYVFYFVPTFSNPGSAIVPLEDRVRLLELARKHDMLIVTDDVYDFLEHSIKREELPPRMVTLDRQTVKSEHGNTISNLSCSKLLGPGLRVGWQETATGALALQLADSGASRSGGTPAHLNTMIIGEMIKMGLFDKVINNLNKVYNARATVYKDALKKYLPEGTIIEGGDGGYFIWVTFDKEKIDVRKMVEQAKEKGLVLASGDKFEVNDASQGWGKTSVRVSVSYTDADRALEGIKIWGGVCDELQKWQKSIDIC